jgi:hypothetical protein
MTTRPYEQDFRIATYWRIWLWLGVYVSFGLGMLSLYSTAMHLNSTGGFDGRALAILPGVGFAYVGFITARSLLSDQPQLVISDRGIQENRSGFGLICWPDLIAAEVKVTTIYLTAYKTLYLKVENPGNYFRRVSLVARLSLPLRSQKKATIPIDFTRLDGTVDEAVTWINTFRPEISVKYSSNTY